MENRARVAVTGASGFIGHHLAHRLTSKGFEVNCIVRPSSRTQKLNHSGMRIYRGDLSDKAFLREAMSGCGVIYHCAAMVSDWGSIREIRAANVELTKSLLEVSEEVGLSRFVYVSTTDIYGHPGEKNLTEVYSDKPKFFNWYAETKRQAEGLVRASSLPYCIVRPATVYGPGSASLVDEFVSSLRKGIGFTVGGGESLSGLVYVDDVVDAIETIGSHAQAEGETFNVSSPEEVTWNSFLRSLAAQLQCRYRKVNLPLVVASPAGLACELFYRYLLRLFGLRLRPLLSRQAVQILGIDQSFSSVKAQRLLNFQPKVGLEEGLQKTIQGIAQVS